MTILHPHLRSKAGRSVIVLIDGTATERQPTASDWTWQCQSAGLPEDCLPARSHDGKGYLLENELVESVQARNESREGGRGVQYTDRKLLVLIY